MNEVYLTYEEYTAYGGDMPQTDFVVAEAKARAQIDRRTDRRVQDMKAVPELVKVCMYAIIRIEASIGITESIEKPKLASFQTDGYSETYVQPYSEKSAERAISESIESLLFSVCDDHYVPLLYRGVSRNA